MPSYRPPPPRPWHLLPVALAAVLWHAAGAADYALTKMRVPAYLDQVPEEWVVYFDALPAWVTAAWAVGVWIGLLGALLLLARESLAPLMLALAFFALAAASVWLVWLAEPPMAEVTGQEGVLVMAGATAASAILWLYARWMRARGVLGG
jgi:hypothetical protein